MDSKKWNARQLTTYCGLWCGDCVPAQRELYESARQLQRLMEEYHFAEYAASKAARVPEFLRFHEFEQTLAAILREECTVPCVDGPCSEANCGPGCPIRVCVLGKRLAGCWECPEHEQCPLLLDMVPRHPDLMYSLRMIAAHGVESWADWRGAHHPWQKRQKPGTEISQS